MIFVVDWAEVAKGLAEHRPPTNQQLSDLVFDALANDPGMARRAADAVNDFTRVRMREDGFFRRIMPPVAITNDELDRAVDTDRPVLIMDRAEEPEPAAISIPFGTLPERTFIRGPRYRINWDLPQAEPVAVHNVASVEELQRLINEGGPDDRSDPAEGEHRDPGALPGAVPDVLPERRAGWDGRAPGPAGGPGPDPQQLLGYDQ